MKHLRTFESFTFNESALQDDVKSLMDQNSGLVDISDQQKKSILDKHVNYKSIKMFKTGFEMDFGNIKETSDLFCKLIVLYGLDSTPELSKLKENIFNNAFMEIMGDKPTLQEFTNDCKKICGEVGVSAGQK